MELVIILMILTVTAETASTAGIDTENQFLDQYLELGTNGKLACPLPLDFFALFWYDTVEHSLVDPILKFQKGIKSGAGFENGNYDVDPNGYLIIPEVSISHEGVFTCLYFEAQNDDPVTVLVNLIVTVSPFPMWPVIDKCVESACFRTLEDYNKVTCSVLNVRPVIEIAWYIRANGGDDLVMDQTYALISNPNGTFSTITTTTVKNSFQQSLTLTMFVCKPKARTNVNNFTESTLLIEHGMQSEPTYSNSEYFERFSTMTLTCGDENNLLYLVWRRHSKDPHGEYMIVTSTGMRKYTIQSDVPVVDETGALIVHNVDIEHEDRYSCLYSDGITDNITYYEVWVYVLPDPPYPVVNGCTHDQYCVIDVTRQGALSCALFGVRPEVDLELKTALQIDSRKINFFEREVKLKANDDKYDIIVTTKYKIEETALVRLTLECVTTNAHIIPLELSSTFDLILVDDFTQSTSYTDINNPAGIPSSKSRMLITVAVIITVICLVCLMITLFIYKGRRGNSSKLRETSVAYEKDELKSMLPNVVSDDKCEVNAETLKFELQSAYKPMYNSICPIPFLQEKVFSVKEIYVDGGIELYVTGKMGHKTWVSLSSYQDILKQDISWSSIRVVEGGPGYGKSILGLLLAHDWCGGISSLRNFDIFVFLRLRQLAMTESLFSAIKLLLLPDDTELTNLDIENVIKQRSVLLLLDGYDEIKESEKPDYIKKILGMQILQKLKVIVTTRTSCLPKEVQPSVTRIRLTGFDDVAREKYISNVVVHENLNPTEVIKKSLEDNPILRDFFQVPFIFVMFAHIAHEQNADVKFHSVTSFFQYMLSCFHSHQRNKYEHESDRIASKEFEKDHSNLDSLALKSILTGRKEGEWSKQEISSTLGEEFLEQYQQTGILIETMNVFYSNKLEMASESPVQREFMIRFFHGLFSEWFAAFALAKKVEDIPDEDIVLTLRQLKPLHFQYLYRFSCGISNSASAKLINYLRRIRDGQEFAILCLLEQSGRIEDIKDIVTEICKEPIYINPEASRLLQRSTIQLVDIASRAEIFVTCIHLEKCFHSVNLAKGGILLTRSELYLPRLTFVDELKITEIGREMTLHETRGLLKYVVSCHQLKRFSLECCMVPNEILEGSLLKEFRTSETKVFWNPIVTWYRLDSDGKWKNEEDMEVMTPDVYQEVLAQFRDSWSDMPWQNSRRSERIDD